MAVQNGPARKRVRSRTRICASAVMARSVSHSRAGAGNQRRRWLDTTTARAVLAGPPAMEDERCSSLPSSAGELVTGAFSIYTRHFALLVGMAAVFLLPGPAVRLLGSAAAA